MMDPTVATVIAIISAIVGVASLVYGMSRSSRIDDRELRKMIADASLASLTHINSCEDKIQKQIEELIERIAKQEAKVGLFWGLVEDLMPKLFTQLNPITLDENESRAYESYKRFRNKTSTPELRFLEAGLDRELHTRKDIPSDEFFAAFLMLTAIKAQLVDRGEEVVKSHYQEGTA